MKNPCIEISSEYPKGHYNTVWINGELLCLCHTDIKSDSIREMIKDEVKNYQLMLSIKNNTDDSDLRDRVENRLLEMQPTLKTILNRD